MAEAALAVRPVGVAGTAAGAVAAASLLGAESPTPLEIPGANVIFDALETVGSDA